MNTKAQIARLRAQAEEMEAQAWDKRAEAESILTSDRRTMAWALPDLLKAKSYAISCRERAASYIQDSEQAEREDG